MLCSPYYKGSDVPMGKNGTSLVCENNFGRMYPPPTIPPINHSVTSNN